MKQFAIPNICCINRISTESVIVCEMTKQNKTKKTKTTKKQTHKSKRFQPPLSSLSTGPIAFKNNEKNVPEHQILDPPKLIILGSFSGFNFGTLFGVLFANRFNNLRSLFLHKNQPKPSQEVPWKAVKSSKYSKNVEDSKQANGANFVTFQASIMAFRGPRSTPKGMQRPQKMQSRRRQFFIICWASVGHCWTQIWTPKAFQKLSQK